MAENDTSTILIFTRGWRGDRMARWLEAALFSLEEVGMRVQIRAWQLPFFFLSSFFLPFSFLLFILTADPFSFARFLRKRISSTTIGQSPILNIILRDRSYTNSKDNRNYKQKWLHCLPEKCQAAAGGGGGGGGAKPKAYPPDAALPNRQTKKIRKKKKKEKRGEGRGERKSL